MARSPPARFRRHRQRRRHKLSPTVATPVRRQFTQSAPRIGQPLLFLALLPDPGRRAVYVAEMAATHRPWRTDQGPRIQHRVHPDCNFCGGSFPGHRHAHYAKCDPRPGADEIADDSGIVSNCVPILTRPKANGKVNTDGQFSFVACTILRLC